MKSREILLKAFKRMEKERGLLASEPNDYLSSGHIKKADHNLIVMTDMDKLGYEDWVVIVAYYAMYHSALGLLVKIGLDSKDHATTVAVLEYFFGEQIGKELLEKFNHVKEKKDKIESIIIEDKYIDYLWKIKRARETVQYGISLTYKETNVVIKNARAFVSRIKIVIAELDGNLVEAIGKKIRELKEAS
jgi:uncharacterized protein (UPF0332 family)